MESVTRRSPALAGRFSTTSATLEALLQIFQLVKSITLWLFWASQVAQRVKNLPAMQETWVQSLGWKDPLEKGRATHSSILAWRTPWTIQPTGSQRVRHAWEIFTINYENRLKALDKILQPRKKSNAPIFEKSILQQASNLYRNTKSYRR